MHLKPNDDVALVALLSATFKSIIQPVPEERYGAIACTALTGDVGCVGMNKPQQTSINYKRRWSDPRATRDCVSNAESPSSTAVVDWSRQFIVKVGKVTRSNVKLTDRQQ